jgi:hypothetical protein
MANIDNLCVSLLNMPEEEAMKFLHELRALRRVRPDAPRKKKAAKGKRTATETTKGRKKVSKLTAAQAVESMSPEQKKQLLLKLTGG